MLFLVVVVGINRQTNNNMCLTSKSIIRQQGQKKKLVVKGFSDWKGFTKALPEDVQEKIDYHTFGKQAELNKKELIRDFKAYYWTNTNLTGSLEPEEYIKIKWMDAKKPDWATAFDYDKRVTYHKHQRTTVVRVARKALEDWERDDLGDLFTTPATNEHGFKYINQIYDERSNMIYEGDDLDPEALQDDPDLWDEDNIEGMCEYMNEVWDSYWIDEFHGGQW
jgi:hypothetical protein